MCKQRHSENGNGDNGDLAFVRSEDWQPDVNVPAGEATC